MMLSPDRDVARSLWAVASGRDDMAHSDVVVVRDELDLATTPALRREVEAALRRRPERLTIDLSGCTFISVDAITLLASLTAVAGRRGTSLVVVGLCPTARRVVSLLELDDVLVSASRPG